MFRPRNYQRPAVQELMKPTILAGLAYFAFVLGTGFALGMVRVPLLVPRIGERWAELAEMPFDRVTLIES